MGVQKQAASGIWTTGHSVLSLVYKVKFWTTQLQFKALTQLSGFVSCYDRAAHSPLFQWWAFHTFARLCPWLDKSAHFHLLRFYLFFEVQDKSCSSVNPDLHSQEGGGCGLAAGTLSTTPSTREGEHHPQCVLLRDWGGESAFLTLFN